ncbi:ATP-binding protein [Nucisporomicrobium flavum]|uniref:ATP-binding protein n=1 Tax=Nucisporomicrobium flavum TaxID=2785915 RepID=UPI0018F6D0F1|nr:tetratricopeptide repeat protein [Nucisporomicrobium flavum]
MTDFDTGSPVTPPLRNDFSGRADTVVQAGTVGGTFNLQMPRKLGSPRPRQLPPSVPAFVNRTFDLRRLDAALDRSLGASGAENSAVVISALSGPAGVGKTALAVHWAHHARNRFPDGDLFVNLRGYDAALPTPPQQVLESFLRALDVPASRIPANLDEQAALYRSLLDGRRMLVLLDNASNAEQVRPLLPGTRSCVVVITSRSRLSGLVIREGAGRMVLDALTPDEAVTLLGEILGSDRIRADPEGARFLAEQCAYLPLALRIVAEKAGAEPGMALGELADQLASQRRRLDAFAVDDDLSEIRAVFSWSYQALPGDAARVFRLLGAHIPPDIDTPAVAALAQLPVDEARRSLSALSDIHLLVRTDADRFRIHDLLRAYAVERFETEEPEAQRLAASRRLLDWFFAAAYESYRAILPQGRLFAQVEFGRDAATLPVFTDQASALKWCESQHANLMAAITMAEDLRFDDLVWKIAVSCMAFLERLSYRTDWILSHEKAVAATRRLRDRAAEGFVLMLLGDAYWFRGRLNDALSTYQSSVAASRDAHDRWTEGFALRGSGLVHQDLGNFAEATARSEEALGVFRLIGETRGEAMSLLSIGNGLSGLGRLDEALAKYGEALQVCERIANPWIPGMVSNQIGRVHAAQGRHLQAIEDFKAAIEIFEGLKDHRHLSFALRDIGTSYLATDQLAAARSSWQLAHDLLTNLDDPEAGSLAAKIASLPS